MQHEPREPTATRQALAVIHNPVFGGGTNLLMCIAPPLRERGWDVVAMVPELPEARPTLERMRTAGLPTGTLELHRLRRTPDPRVQLPFIASLRREIARLRGLIRRERVDVVLAFGDTNPHLAIAGHLEGVAVVWTLYDTVTPPLARRLTMPVVRSIADVILTWGRALARAYPGAEALGERCIPVFPPVDSERFVPDAGLRAAARAQLGVPAEGLLVGAVGVRNPTKGHERLARAAAELCARGHDVWVRVLGAPSPVHSEYMSEVDREVERLALSDRFVITDPGERVAELMPAFDVFALSSVPRSEGMPTAIFEAMSCGLPVVATDVGAVSEYVEEGKTGFVVPPLDERAQARALERLLVDRELRARMGEEARRRILERYSIDRCAAVYADAFELALEHRSRR